MSVLAGVLQLSLLSAAAPVVAQQSTSVTNSLVAEAIHAFKAALHAARSNEGSLESKLRLEIPVNTFSNAHCSSYAIFVSVSRARSHIEFSGEGSMKTFHDVKGTWFEGLDLGYVAQGLRAQV
ncbi:hypothetical protein BCR37DRAFT_387857 [Protomyces lactucae-debilis]|uniref:Uncharacterized protein n=1 Tax=Protomyces lactucae-debilis TaxID=2754530 RepID=A0A1Y2FBU2_PROLT|nr:uncharacterized protein BCR37DRAFT_387857 [Protomyces lactucae-debilis]ORY80796.1 hypothetical protein BCR37DRAFT_387857 [Protomyces lactucae-debilis]